MRKWSLVIALFCTTAAGAPRRTSSRGAGVQRPTSALPAAASHQVASRLTSGRTTPGKRADGKPSLLTHPVHVTVGPMGGLFTRGFAMMPIPKDVLEAFGPSGDAVKWMSGAPDGTIFRMPVHPQGQWHFNLPKGVRYEFGQNPAWDETLVQQLAPAARRVVDAVVRFANEGDPLREYRANEHVIFVKSFDGRGAGAWHEDGQEAYWDTRAVGVLPLGERPPTLVLHEGVAYTAPPKHLVFFEAKRTHKGIDTPGLPRGIFGVDLKATLRDP